MAITSAMIDMIKAVLSLFCIDELLSASRLPLVI